MSTAGGSVPWWASGSTAEDGVDPGADPVELHRAARRGSPVGDDRPAASHDPDVCGVCPICSGLRLLGETNPELLDHLSEAARHLTAAVRALLEAPSARDAAAAGDTAAGDADGPDAHDRFTRIDVE